MNTFLSILRSLPGDFVRWCGGKLTAMARFAAADHPYVYLSSCVLAAASLLIYLNSSEYGFFLSQSVLVMVSFALCAAFALVALAALGWVHLGIQKQTQELKQHLHSMEQTLT